MWNGRTDSQTLVYHNTSRFTDGRLKSNIWQTFLKLGFKFLSLNPPHTTKGFFRPHCLYPCTCTNHLQDPYIWDHIHQNSISGLQGNYCQMCIHLHMHCHYHEISLDMYHFSILLMAMVLYLMKYDRNYGKITIPQKNWLIDWLPTLAITINWKLQSEIIYCIEYQCWIYL
jgi:hypothetical protein